MPEGIEGGVAGGVVGGVAGGVQELRPREDFRPLALFAARCVTDESGALHVPVLLPDTITRYRIMVVGATKGNQFGSGESSLTVGLALALRASPPRFLNVGDPRRTVVQRTESRGDEAADIRLAVRATNARLTAGAGRRATVPPLSQIEVRIPLEPIEPGVARVEAALVSERSM